jgi:predicted DNA-binding protein
MSEPILRIQRKKYQAETTVVSMRLPKDMLRDIDSVAAMTGRTRNEILTTGVEFALKHMEIVLKEEEK